RSTTLSTLQRKVLSNPDYFLPVREHAPSRLRILLAPEGPFSGAHKGNRRGVLFSALVFRGITFDTPALKSTAHSHFFANLAEWNQFHSAHARELSGAARERPFGRTHGRSTANAAQFWGASAILLAFLATPDLKRYPHGPRFLDVVKHIATATHRKKTAYPTFGRLVAYLVAVDLAYAGEIPAPTLDEMGDVIEYIDKGAVGGLRVLQLFHGKGPDGAGQVFKHVFRYLDTALTETQKTEMRFDVFMVEHGLCKVKRLYNLKAFII
ncbi:hypothetical protein BJ912DRAFT_860433, partial [Pholiota molesta]